MYLLAKSDDHRSCRNGDINSYINTFMKTLDKAELTVSIHHNERFLKSGISIYNSQVLGMVCKKTRGRRRRRGTQAIAKRYAFYANVKRCQKRFFVNCSFSNTKTELNKRNKSIRGCEFRHLSDRCLIISILKEYNYFGTYIWYLFHAELTFVFQS